VVIGVVVAGVGVVGTEMPHMLLMRAAVIA